MKSALLIVGFVSTLAAPAFAAVPFENGLVPLEVFTEVSGGGIPYRSLPDDFPVPASVPAGLNLRMTASVVSATNQQVLLRSTADIATLRAGLLSAYKAAGWTDTTSPAFLGIQGAFPISLCNDQLGSLNINFTAATSDTKVTVSRTPKFPGTRSCSQTAQANDMQRSGDAATTALLPKLTLPPGADIPPVSRIANFISGGSSSIRDDELRYEKETTAAFVLTDTTMSNLFTYFASQLAQQGWLIDSDGVGSRSAASVWLRTTAVTMAGATGSRPTDLSGTLEILRVAPDTYQYKFMMRAVISLK